MIAELFQQWIMLQYFKTAMDVVLIVGVLLLVAYIFKRMDS